VDLACNFTLDRMPLPPGLAELRSLPDAVAHLGPRIRRAAKRVEPGRQVWLYAQRDPWLRERARRADVLVALDVRAVHTVWQFAHRNRRADAVFGLAPALRAVDARARNRARYAARSLLRVGPSPAILVSGVRRRTKDAVKTTARLATGRRVMRSGAGRGLWGLAVTVPGLPDGVRGRVAGRVHESMIRAGHPASAARTAAAAAARMGGKRPRADLLDKAAIAELRTGRLPAFFSAAVDAELAIADAAYVRGNLGRAATGAYRAIQLLLHRGIHYDGLTSPLAEDAERFLAPWHRSEVGRALGAPRGRKLPAAPRPTDRPTRILLVTRLNTNFLGEIRQRYTDLPDTEVRLLDLGTDPVREPLTRRISDLVEHRLGGKPGYGAEVEEWLRPHLDWADTVFVDWCTSSAALVTLVDPGTARIIVRLHSFEAFAIWPQVVDFSRVDDLVFVSDHLRDLTLAAVPRLTAPGAPRTPVVGNAMDLRRYAREKPAEARFTLGLVGISAIAKDPRWAIEVLRELRRVDARYRLLLVGSDVNGRTSPAAKAYQQAYLRDVAELEPSGAVVRTGQTHDVPAALTDVGVMISSSVREGSPCGLIEGAASGAVPVVRDWPFFAGKPHGARTLFPADWVVDTPQQAAERILKVTATEDGWREAGRAASAHALATWDWPVIQDDFDRLLLRTDTSTSTSTGTGTGTQA
jgi:glycosyltransferase involved in cell wall biosynthesis